MSRLCAYGLGLGLVTLVLAKGAGDVGDDSYPLSTYPMFARARDKPWLNFVEGVDQAAQPVRLTPELIASGEVMQAAATVRRAVEAGPGAMDALCVNIAARVAQAADLQTVRQVRIVAASFDPVRYFVEGPTPEQRDVLFACLVPGRP
jgi:hypothetical protein